MGVAGNRRDTEHEPTVEEGLVVGDWRCFAVIIRVRVRIRVTDRGQGLGAEGEGAHY